MARFITPIVLIGITISVFFMFTDSIYNDISVKKLELTSYNEALDNSKALEKARDTLTSKYNTINLDDLTKLAKLLPSGIDNIRLILEIEQIASPYGMTLKDVKYNTTDNSKNANTSADSGMPTGTIIQGGAVKAVSKDYGVFDLEFSTSGTYNNFINFLRDLESNLRIVDISSISFSVEGGNAGATGSGAKTSSPEIYKYNFKIKTYWLKD